MKRALVGGFLGLIGTLWAMALGGYVQNNLVSNWMDNRFWESAANLGMAFPLALALICAVAGIVLLVVELFRKDA